MKRKVLLITFLVLVLVLPVLADELQNEQIQAMLRSITKPKLEYPKDVVVSMSNRPFLEFRWAASTNALIKRNYFDFKLYKGKAVERKNLIFAQRLPYDMYSLQVNASLFEHNQVYTWTLTQTYLRGDKVDTSLGSFKVIQ